MRKTAKYLLSLAVALLLMFCFRALVCTVYTVDGSGLEPLLHKGDRVLVNRWSYGLRVGSNNGLFSYGRLARRAVGRGDIVAFEHPDNDDLVLICRCKALPGDTVEHEGLTLVVPSTNDCADANYYWMEAVGGQNTIDSRLLGFISEEHLIGRVTMVLYNHSPAEPLWKGWDGNRFLLPL